MLQRLPVALAQVKTNNTSANLLKSEKLYNLYLKQKKLLKKYKTI